MKNFLVEFSLLGAVLLTGWGLVFVFYDAPLMSAPHLVRQLSQTAGYAKMAEGNVHQATLFCDRLSRKVGATFTFDEYDGRGGVTAVGETPCDSAGRLAVIDGGLKVRQDYDPEFLGEELGRLVVKAGITRNLNKRFNDELALVLNERFGEVATQRNIRSVTFACKEAGAPFEFQAFYPETVRTGALHARCENALQRFNFYPPGPTSANRVPVLFEYRAISQSLAEDADSSLPSPRP